MDIDLLWDNVKTIQSVFVENGWLKLDLLLDVYVNVESVRILCRSKVTLDVEAYGKIRTIVNGLDFDDETPRRLKRIEFVHPNEVGILLDKAASIIEENVEFGRKWKVEH